LEIDLSCLSVLSVFVGIQSHGLEANRPMYEEDDEEQEWPVVQVMTPANALEYLQSIYRNPSEPDGRRMRAAMAALPFETPKLAVTTSLSNENFALMLDRAIARSQGAEIKLIEHRAEPERSDGR
jgi:hypothetical protein